MKILVITTTFPRWNNDHVPAFVYELSMRIQDRGIDVVVLAPHYPGAKRFEIMDKMKIYRFPYFYPYKYQKLAYDGGILPNIKKSHLAKIQVPLLFLSELYYTFKIIKKENIDIVHSHWIVPNGLTGAIFGSLSGMLHITTAHAGDIFTIRKSKLFSRIARYIFKNSDKITANSKFTRDVIIQVDNSIKNKVKIIHMGVDTLRFNPKRAIGLNYKFSADYIILSIGRLVDKKGIRYLIVAMREVIKIYPNTKLIIGGSGPEKERLERLSKNLGLNDNIIFAGYIKDIDLPMYYASSDIFVLPSIETKGGDTEGLGIVLLEAMASKTSLIGSDIGGITDIIIDNDNGLLTKPGSSKDIADKIITLLQDKKLRHSLSEKGLKTVNESFSWDVIIEKFINLYKGDKDVVFKRCRPTEGNEKIL